MNNADLMLINASADAIPLPSGVVHSHCTSPPYWRQRDYSQGDDSQACYWREITYSPSPSLRYDWLTDDLFSIYGLRGNSGGRELYQITVPPMTCALGMEPTPEYFIGHLVAVYREVARVCRDDSAGWCVIGDCFWDSNRRRATREVRPLVRGEEDGNLIGISHRLMLALQADGWICRNDVVWAKRSPMPESVAGGRWERCRIKIRKSRASNSKPQVHGIEADPNKRGRNPDSSRNPELQAQYRPCPGCPACERTGGYVLRRGSWRHTRAHETVLMLTRGMGYFADQERVREVVSDGERFHGAYASGNPTQSDNGRGRQNNTIAGRNPRSVLTDDSPVDFIAWLAQEYGDDLAADMLARLAEQRSNPGDVVTPKPESYPGQHYAVYPRSLIAPLIQATCPTRCCPVCGSGWSPVVERDVEFESGSGKAGNKPAGKWNGTEQTESGTYDIRMGPVVHSNVLGYRPTCECEAPLGVKEIQVPYGPDADAGFFAPEPVPGLLLDPFCGSGTTLLVAHELGLRGIGLDLSGKYLAEQAAVRALGHTPVGALAELPLFQELE